MGTSERFFMQRGTENNKIKLGTRLTNKDSYHITPTALQPWSIRPRFWHMP